MSMWAGWTWLSDPWKMIIAELIILEFMLRAGKGCRVALLMAQIYELASGYPVISQSQCDDAPWFHLSHLSCLNVLPPVTQNRIVPMIYLYSMCPYSQIYICVHIPHDLLTYIYIYIYMYVRVHIPRDILLYVIIFPVSQGKPRLAEPLRWHLWSILLMYLVQAANRPLLLGLAGLPSLSWRLVRVVWLRRLKAYPILIDLKSQHESQRSQPRQNPLLQRPPRPLLATTPPKQRHIHLPRHHHSRSNSNPHCHHPPRHTLQCQLFHLPV